MYVSTKQSSFSFIYFLCTATLCWNMHSRYWTNVISIYYDSLFLEEYTLMSALVSKCNQYVSLNIGKHVSYLFQWKSFCSSDYILLLCFNNSLFQKNGFVCFFASWGWMHSLFKRFAAKYILFEIYVVPIHQYSEFHGENIKNEWINFNYVDQDGQGSICL